MTSELIAVEETPPSAGPGTLEPMRSKSLFWQADHVAGGPALSVLPFLFWLIENTDPGLLVSFDPAPGEAYFAFCQAISRLSLDTRAFNVRAETPEPDMQHRNTASYEVFSTLLSTSEAPATTRFSENAIDLFYVDLAALPDDLEAWADKLSSRCAVVLHGATDAALAGNLGSCLKRLDIPATDFTLNCGKGVALALGPDAPARLKVLSHMGTPGYSEAYRAFHRLGTAQKDAFRARAEAAARQAAEAELERMRQVQESMAQTIEGLEEKLAALERTHEARCAQIAALEADQAETGMPLQEARDQIEALTAALRLKDAELSQLQSTSAEKIATLDSKCTWLRGEVAKHQSEARDMTAARDEAIAQAEAAARETARAQAEAIAQAEAAAREEANARAEAAAQDKAIARSEISDLKAELETRTDELVALTQLFETEAGKLRAKLRDAQEWHEIQIELRDAEIAVRRGAKGLIPARDAGARAGLPSMKRQVALLNDSELFDAAWYLSTYPDVSEAGADPAQHYVLHGALDGRNPGPRFDTMAYYRANRDVARRGMNALVHYEMFGREENRSLRETGS